MPMVVGLPLILTPCVFVIVAACTFQLVGPVFLYTFFLTFVLGVSVRLVLA